MAVSPHVGAGNQSRSSVRTVLLTAKPPLLLPFKTFLTEASYLTFWSLKGLDPAENGASIPNSGRGKSEFYDIRKGFLYPIGEAHVVTKQKVQRQKVSGRSSDWQILLVALPLPVCVHSMPHPPMTVTAGRF